jgi:hypothetical protein
MSTSTCILSQLTHEADTFRSVISSCIFSEESSKKTIPIDCSMTRSQISFTNRVVTNNITTHFSCPNPDSAAVTHTRPHGNASIKPDADINDTMIENAKGLRSSVWRYATKVTTETARCNECGAIIKTIQGSTSSLRKHILHRHNVVQSNSRKSSSLAKNSSISREKKSRLDHLLKLAAFEDGRSFGDFRKSGIMKFFAEALPGQKIVQQKKIYLAISIRHVLFAADLWPRYRRVGCRHLTFSFAVENRSNNEWEIRVHICLGGISRFQVRCK